MPEPKVLLFRGRGVISALIRWQTRSVYSHAALLLEDGETIIEAWQGDGVRKKKLGSRENIDAFRVAGGVDWPTAIAFAEAQIGKRYDYRQVFRFLSRRSGKTDEHWFCSELVFAALREGDVPLLERIEPWAVSPGLLAVSPWLSKDETW